MSMIASNSDNCSRIAVRGRGWECAARLLSGKAALGVLLVVHTGMLAWTAAADSPTNDEPFHLAGGIRRVKEGLFDVDRGTPLSGTVAALPVVLMKPKTQWQGAPDSFAVGRDFINENKARSFWLITIGRWACIPFSLLGCMICWHWSRELNGDLAGFVAAAFWSFCPNVIAHGHLITGDMAATSLGAAALYSYWRWLRKPILSRAIVAGLVLGGALLAKHVLLILCFLYPLLWTTWSLGGGTGSIRSAAKQLAHLAIIALASLWVINLAYLFQGTGEPLARYRVGRRFLELVAPAARAESPSKPVSSIAWFPVPFPEDYVLAIDEIDHHYAAHKKKSYLRGEWKSGGWWHYYVYAILVKTPLGTLSIMALAAFLSLSFVAPISAGLRNELALVVPVIVILDFVTLATSQQSHVRYVLPALPFALIWASKVARPEVIRARIVATLVGSSLVATVAGCLSVFPHSLSYFNWLAGGPRNGHAHLLDSNIDWGQDLVYLKTWLDAHPEARPLHLVYHGLVDPSIIGIEYRPVPKLRGYSGEELNLPEEQLGPQPGWYAVSVQQARSRPYDYFFRFRPKALAGYSFYIFDLTCADANRGRKELGLPLLNCPTGTFNSQSE